MSQPITIETSTTEQTVTVGQAIGRNCQAGDVVALQGELGAGKTQLVRGIAMGMGLSPRQVSSPTFVMVQEYEPSDDSDGPVLVHIDAYRISSPDELETIGWTGLGEELRDNAVVAIEWASLIRPALGDDLLWIDVEHKHGGRRILLSAQGPWRDKMQLLSESFRDAGLTHNSLEEGAER